MLTPLPNRRRAEAVEEEEGGFCGGFMRFGAPKGDGGFVIDVDDLLRKAGGGEAAAEISAVQGNETEKGRPHFE